MVENVILPYPYNSDQAKAIVKTNRNGSTKRSIAKKVLPPTA